MRVRFVGFPHTSSYNGASGRWAPGDVREVDDVTGAGLLADFPGCFALVEPPITAPPHHAAIQAPPQARTGRGRR